MSVLSIAWQDIEDTMTLYDTGDLQGNTVISVAPLSLEHCNISYV